MRRTILGFTGLVAMFNVTTAGAYASWQGGHISNVTYVDDYMLIMLDNGTPDNCAGTPYSWMKIPAESKPMIAFVTGLWMRGDAAQVGVTIYTSGLVGGWCQINQIDPG